MKCFEKYHTGGRRIPKGMGPMNGERGISVVEMLIGLMLLGVLAVAFFGGLSASLRAFFLADELETARNIAEKQMEYVMELDYATSNQYTPADISTDYPNYTVNNPIIAVDVTPEGSNVHIQKVAITVYHDSEPEPVITLEDYKVQP
jgi:type II secretory pathway pseudopilin PulG